MTLRQVITLALLHQNGHPWIHWTCRVVKLYGHDCLKGFDIRMYASMSPATHTVHNGERAIHVGYDLIILSGQSVDGSSCFPIAERSKSPMHEWTSNSV